MLRSTAAAAIIEARDCLDALDGIVGRLEAGETSGELSTRCASLRRRVEVLANDVHRRLWGVPPGVGRPS